MFFDYRRLIVCCFFLFCVHVGWVIRNYARQQHDDDARNVCVSSACPKMYVRSDLMHMNMCMHMFVHTFFCVTCRANICAVISTTFWGRSQQQYVRQEQRQQQRGRIIINPFHTRVLIINSNINYHHRSRYDDVRALKGISGVFPLQALVSLPEPS